MKGDHKTRAIGASYEEQACAYLLSLGYKILDRNFTIRGGELDIIAKDGETIIFAEVRYRADDHHGDPLETVTIPKMHRICRTAQYYLLKKGCTGDTPVRFDVIAINGGKLNHITNAFEFSL